MIDSSAALVSRASDTSLSVSSKRSDDRNLGSSLGTSRRGLAWTRGVAALAAALMVLGAFCVPAQAQVTLATNWSQQSPVISPSPRWDGAMAYDSAHSQVVMFGGLGSPGTLSETWLWNGTNWSQANPATVPQARANQAMAYDAAHGQVVMFGGLNSLSTRTNDTWLWNGTNWTQANPSNSPPARGGAAMVYDAALGEIVLFGGLDVNGNALGDTWLWNGTTWSQASPATSPSARFDHAMAYDAAHGQVVLFGGFNAFYFSDTWVWNGTNWIQQAPAISPGARYGNGMDYDAALGQVVMFGGYSGSTYLSDTWTWNGTNWTEQSLATSPAQSYATNSMVYDAAEGGLLLFEGYDGDTDFSYTFLLGTGQNFGSINVCPNGQNIPVPCSNTLTLTYNFATTTTIGSIKVVTQGASGLDFAQANGGNCAGTISAGNSCTLDVTFAPQAPGLRMGAVKIVDNGGVVQATTPIYGVGEGPAIAFGPGTQTTVPAPELNSGQANPYGIAVDAAGNVYIADAGDEVVLKVTPGGVQTTVPFTGLSDALGVAVDGAGDVFVSSGANVVEITPLGVQTNVNKGSYLLDKPGELAVDGAGDLFIADPIGGHVQGSQAVKGEVIEVPANGSSPTLVYNPAAGNPIGVAVDAAGDVFVADEGLAQVVEIPSGCVSSSCQITVGSGWSDLQGLALDAAGDLFVADDGLDAGLGEVVEIPAGCTSSNCQMVMAAGTGPTAVAVDAAGDVFVANGYNPQVIEINQAQPPTLAFMPTPWNVESSDSPQSVSILNVGNQTLTAGLSFPPLYWQQAYLNGTPPDCANSFSLVPGQACNLSVIFDPAGSGQAEGLSSAVYVFNDSLNNSDGQQDIVLTGSTTATNNYLLTVTGGGTGGGTITSNTTINCGLSAGSVTGTCSESDTSGAVVTLTANASGTNTFAGWGGACISAGTNLQCVVTMNSALNVSASFAQGDFATANVCVSGQPFPCSSAFPVSVSYTGPTTVSSAQAVTQGITGLDFAATLVTCGSSSCAVSVTFTPQAAGLRLGAVELLDGSGDVLATQPIYGIGQGAVVAFSPLQAFGRYLGGPNGNAPSSIPLNNPKGVALDAQDNVFIADTGNSQVLELKGNSTQTVGTGFQSPDGVVVDGAGDVFIADSGLGEVIEIPAGCPGCQNVPYGPYGSGEAIGGLAVDAAGDVFVPDATQGWVLELPAGGGFPGTVGSGWVNPAGATMDAAGDLFVADYGIPGVVEVPAGCYSASCQIQVGSGWSQPEAVALDAAGDVYVSDIGLNAVVEVPAGCTSLTCQIKIASGVTSYGVTVDPLGVVSYVD